MTPPSPHIPIPASVRRRLPRQADSRGVALVIVLACLVLMVALVIGFFSSVTTELVASKSQADSSSAERGAEVAVEIAMAQIRAGTFGHMDPADPASARVAWASQPGMIRTWDTAGAPGKFYKLYSDLEMIRPGTGFTTAAAAPPAAWDQSPGVFTDLNSPVVRGSKVNFPILDPRAKTSSPATSVEGFDYTAGVNGVTLAGANPADQRLPMPVRWLYLLEDGTVSAPTGQSGANVSMTPVPTASNPIVGRVAFWTDDDTSKVNVNTASEGVYYDIPRFASEEEYGLSDSPPVIGEFQRYPGHPATTSLSAVFGPWFQSQQLGIKVSDYSKTQKYYQLAPRIGGGDSSSPAGTRGGTVPSSYGLPKMPNEAVRLYASLDEMLYAPDRQENPPKQSAADPVVTKDVLEKTRFFLTPNSRAPDITLFGTPRVTIWPMHDLGKTDPLYRTAQDTLIAFCSEVGRNPSGDPYRYYFQRKNPKSTTADYAEISRNQALLSYLQRETSQDIPGFGGNFNLKFGADRDQLLTEIFDYIRASNLNDPYFQNNNIPQWWKYSYTDSFTYNPDSTASPPLYPNITTATTAYETAWRHARSPGQVLPITIPLSSGTYKGAGRFPVIDQAAMVFYLKEPPTMTTPGVINAKFGAYLLLNLQHPMLGMMSAVDYFKVTGELTGGDFRMAFKGAPSAGNITVNVAPTTPQSLQMLGGLNQVKTLWANFPTSGVGNGRNFGGNHESTPLWAFHFQDAASIPSDSYVNSNPRTQEKIFTFRSYADVNISVAATVSGANLPNDNDTMNRFLYDNVKWDLSGGTIDVRILSSSDEEIQKYTFEFPSVPANEVGVAGSGLRCPAGYRNNPSVDSNYVALSLRDRFYVRKEPFRGRDIVRALQVSASPNIQGDTRLLAYTRDIPAAWFTPNQDYQNSSVDYAHTMRQSWGEEWWAATRYPGGVRRLGGSLVSNLTSSYWARDPFIRLEINGVTRLGGGQGDWDTGFGQRPDGPYLNRADEGMAPLGPASNQKPYFNNLAVPQTGNLTSPNRQLPSAGMFSSLPTGVKRGRPWETLLFRPNLDNHRGGGLPASGPPFTTPPDYLLMDLFQMPIVEPYAISEPLSTAGRVNMNYQIIPFNYITRETGVRAVLKNERVTAIPDTYLGYKTDWNAAKLSGQYRLPVNVPETLKGFEARFGKEDIFRSPSEICSVNIVPDKAPATQTEMTAFWNSHRFTGENLKERPYTTIYPRLTTQSNTYTVHVRAQALKKVPGTSATQWEEGRDQVLSEYRGHSTIERYVDPQDPALPDFATDPSETLGPYYRFRTLTTKKFSP